jgi:hypothetical protein
LVREHIRETLFGSTLEKVQSNLPNSLMVVGPNCGWVKPEAK